jgi:hypothetical protein
MLSDVLHGVTRAARASRRIGLMTAFVVSTSVTAAVAIPLAISATSVDDTTAAGSIERSDERFPSAIDASSDSILAEGLVTPGPSTPPTILPPLQPTTSGSDPTAAADLALAAVGDLPPGNEPVVVLQASNKGPDVAEGVVVAIVVTGATITSVETSLPWRCDAGDDGWICAALELPPAGTHTIDVLVRDADPDGSLLAEIGAVTADAQPTDNVVSVQIPRGR